MTYLQKLHLIPHIISTVDLAPSEGVDYGVAYESEKIVITDDVLKPG